MPIEGLDNLVKRVRGWLDKVTPSRSTSNLSASLRSQRIQAGRGSILNLQAKGRHLLELRRKGLRVNPEMDQPHGVERLLTVVKSKLVSPIQEVARARIFNMRNVSKRLEKHSRIRWITKDIVIQPGGIAELVDEPRAIAWVIQLPMGSAASLQLIEDPETWYDEDNYDGPYLTSTATEHAEAEEEDRYRAKAPVWGHHVDAAVAAITVRVKVCLEITGADV